MLVLSRNVGEELVIGKEVIVRVAGVSGNRAFLAIEAPRKVRVDREEIWLAKKRDRRAAGSCETVGLPPGSGETRQG
jgi:carbon storage regulator